jgi:hypothetical protein
MAIEENAPSERRKELLKKLSNYKTVPGHGPNLAKMTDKQLEFLLKLYKTMFEESFKESSSAEA